jgi:hypothetical protein
MGFEIGDDRPHELGVLLHVHPVAGIREPDEVGVGENCSEKKNKIKK